MRALHNLREYYKRYKICPYHMELNFLVVEKQNIRFCQQCGRFQLLREFDGEKRSCRKKLEEHNTRRRRIEVESHTDDDSQSTRSPDSDPPNVYKKQKVEPPKDGDVEMLKKINHIELLIRCLVQGNKALGNALRPDGVPGTNPGAALHFVVFVLGVLPHWNKVGHEDQGIVLFVIAYAGVNRSSPYPIGTHTDQRLPMPIRSRYVDMPYASKFHEMKQPSAVRNEHARPCAAAIDKTSISQPFSAHPLHFCMPSNVARFPRGFSIGNNNWNGPFLEGGHNLSREFKY